MTPWPVRRSTTIHLDMTRWAVEDRSEVMPPDKVIWKSLKNKSLAKDIRNFLWKSMHNTYKLGKYWSNIPGYENRVTCPTCRVEESLEHILINCKSSEQEKIWDCVKILTEERNLQYYKPMLGNILGCAIPSGYSSETSGDGRFKMIMTAKAGCEWCIMRNSDLNAELIDNKLTNRLKATITRKVKLDCLATEAERFGNKAIKPAIVRST